MKINEKMLKPLAQERAKGLPDHVYDVLLDLLMTGELPPNAPLSIDTVSRELNVSQTPVREALARLEHTGLVERFARKGYRVSSPLSHEGMVELLDARMILETSALSRAMVLYEELLPGLEAAQIEHVAAADRLAKGGDELDPALVRTYFTKDWQFHQAILDRCNNRYIGMAVNGLAYGLHRMRQTLGTGHSDAQQAVAEHRTIIDAVATGDRDKAVAALEKHLLSVKERSAAIHAEWIESA